MIRGDDPVAGTVAETVSINPWSGNDFTQDQSHLQGAGNAVSTTGRQSSWGSVQMSWTPPNVWQTQLPQQQAWGSSAATAMTNSPTSSASFTSYAEQAKKNVPVTSVASGGANVISSTSSYGQTQQQPRHPLSNAVPNTWASGSIKVDQHTPWDVSGVQQPPQGGAGGGAPSMGGTWNAGQPAATTSPWQLPQSDQSLVANGLVQQTGSSGDWSQASMGPAHHIQRSPLPPPPPPHPHLATAAPQQQRHPQHYEATANHHQSARNWSVNPMQQPGGWGVSTGEGAATIPTAIPIPIDPNPHAPGQWVAPQPSEMNSDMMWHDPNPKQKKIQRDTGTSIWGDPNTQRDEIRRWKAGDDEDDPATGSGDGQQQSNEGGPRTATQLEWGTSRDGGGQDQGRITSGTENGSAIVERGWGEPPHPMQSQTAGNGAQWGSASANWPPVQHHRSSTGSDAKSPDMDGSFQPMRNEAGSARQPSSCESLVKVAVDRALIGPSALQRVYQDSDRDRLVAELRTLLQRLFDKEEELQRCRSRRLQSTFSAVHNSDSDEDRLIYEIQSAKSDLLELQRIMGINVMSGQPQAESSLLLQGEVPTAAQSRLQQWKNSPTDAGAASLLKATQNLNIHTATTPGDDWKSGTLDWSSPGSSNPIGANKMTDAQHTHLEQLNGAPGAVFDDGPPEFVPGKRWEWRDPNKVAEDPNACPSMHKPNPLLTASFSHGYSQSPTGGTMFQQSLANFNTPPQSAGFDAESGFSTGKQPPPPLSSGGSNPWPGYSPSPAGDGSWVTTKRHGGDAGGGSFTTAMPPPPSSSGNPFVVPPPITARMQQPYAAAAPPFCLPGGYWILFELNNISTQQLQGLCSRVGRLMNLLVVGHRIACAKFTDTNIDMILQRIKLEYASDVKVVAEDEFQYMMQNSVRATPITVLWPAIQPQWGSPAVSDQQPPAMGPPPSAAHSSFTPTMPGNI